MNIKNSYNMIPQKVRLSLLFLLIGLICSSVDARRQCDDGQRPRHLRLRRRFAQSNNYVARWASSGGGWRAQAAAQGYANLFEQNGLISGSAPGSTSSPKFTAISTNSGSAWFGTQFFFSQEFYDKTVKVTPSELHDFILDWMQSYLDMQNNIPSSPLCEAGDSSSLASSLGPIFGVSSAASAKQLCDILVNFNGSWANFVEAMLKEASTSAYNDADFTSCTASPDNKQESLVDIELFIELSLAPNSLVSSPSVEGGGNSTISYLMSSDDDSSSRDPEVYTVPIAGHYAVKANGETPSFDFALHDQPSPLRVVTGPAPANFPFYDFSDFYLYPGANGQIKTTLPSDDYNNTQGTMPLNAPFGGGAALVTQVASASSAAVGTFAGSVPSVLAQQISVFLAPLSNGITTNATLTSTEEEAQQTHVLGLADTLYKLPLTHGLAVCTQWPNECTPEDGQFIDG